MQNAEERNRLLINAVIEKEKLLCPGALALIGVYGSFETGDTHPLSDLDLLILINDDRGRQLEKAFIQEDIGVGHDLYCTGWDSLRQDALYEHPHIAKLMDSRVVYCADARWMAELEKLRSGVRERLAAPFDAADREKAEGVFREAKLAYAEAMMADNLPEVRRQAGILLWHTENAIALLNKTYYHFGVRRRYEELSSMSKRPEALCAMIEDIVSAHEIMTLKACLTRMMRETAPCFEKALPKYTPSEQPPAAEALRGTYEEIYSNWRGKMHLASETGDRHLAFMSLLSLEGLLSGITGRTQMKPFSVMAAYDPLDLDKTKRGFDAFLRNYEKEYRRAGLEPALYRDAEAFVSAYLDRPGAGKEP